MKKLFLSTILLVTLLSTSSGAAEYSSTITPLLLSTGELNFGFVRTKFTMTPAKRWKTWGGKGRIKYSKHLADADDFRGTKVDFDFRRPSKDGRAWILDVTLTHPNFGVVLESGRPFVAGSFQVVLSTCNGASVSRNYSLNRPLNEVIAEFEQFDFTEFKSCELEVTEGFVADRIKSEFDCNGCNTQIYPLQMREFWSTWKEVNFFELLPDGTLVQIAGTDKALEDSPDRFRYLPAGMTIDPVARQSVLGAVAEFVRLIKDHGRNLVQISLMPNLPEVQKRNLTLASLETKRSAIMAQLALIKKNYASLTIVDKISSAVAIRDAYGFVNYLESQINALPDARVNLDTSISEILN